jgi:hypothetical protein
MLPARFIGIDWMSYRSFYCTMIARRSTTRPSGSGNVVYRIGEQSTPQSTGDAVVEAEHLVREFSRRIGMAARATPRCSIPDIPVS